VNGTEGLVCPRCLGTLAPHGETWSCSGCASSYRGLRGIPDLRTADDGYLANADDWAFALRLAEDYDRLDFRGLLDRYFDLSPEIPADLRRRQVTHILTAPERARGWIEALGTSHSGPLLDLGCGTGSFLAAIEPEPGERWGIDIALRWLLVARKRLDEEGRGDVRLVCGCAERLPFAAKRFAAVVAGDVIEHVGDQDATLAEAHRVLEPGGRLFLAAPNRFSLAPEPHVQVWGVGFLPRRWMASYVWLVRRVDFRAIRTLGYAEWERLLQRSPFGRGDVRAPQLPDADLVHFGPLKRTVGRIYNRLVATGPGQALARAVGPLFHVVCRREPDRVHRTHVPAPRRRSTSTAAPG
jgi:SAM-dependent methyltransferase